MDQTDLIVRPTPSWNGPKGSTFSPDWKDALTFLTPDVILPSPPPDCQHSTSMTDLHQHHHPLLRQPQVGGGGVFITAVPPSTPTEAPDAGPNGLTGAKVEPSYGTVQKNHRRGRPVSAVDPHRRSQSLCAAAAADGGAGGGAGDPVTLRRRCESYAMAYPSSSSDDSGSDSASTRKGGGGELLPDAVPRPRARSIILRKPKRRPAPPERTVSLGKHGGERRCQSLYIPRDLHSTLLPDLIPIAKLEDGDTPGTPLPTDATKTTATATATTITATAKVKPTVSSTSSRPLNELRSSEPCKTLQPLQPCSAAIPVPPPAPGPPPSSETAKTPSSSDSLNSPTSSCRSSPSQLPATSPSKPTGSTSPSSGYSSQCDTPTGPVRTSAIFGPSPMGCRMRPKPAGQKSRASRVRLSLQLPETTATETVLDEPGGADPDGKPSRRYSDSSATAKPKPQRCLSMLLPVVTQEDLQNVRLKSVSSDEGGRFEVFADAIAEEAERDTPTPSIESPKNRPPVAPKPPASVWQPIMAGQSIQPEQQPPPQVSPSCGPEKRRAPIPKPKRSSLSLSGGSVDHSSTQPNLNRPVSCHVPDTTAQSNFNRPVSCHVPDMAQSNLNRSVSCHVADMPQPPSRPVSYHVPDTAQLPSRPVSYHVSDTAQLPSHTFPAPTTDSHHCDTSDDKKRAMPPPPVARKPEVLILPNGHGVCNRDMGMMPAAYVPANGYPDPRLVNINNMPMQHHFPVEHGHGKYNTTGKALSI